MSKKGKKSGETVPLQEDPKRNIGYDFIGMVVGGGVIGLLLDRLAGTAPWCLIGLVLVGFIAGIVNAWYAMKIPDQE